MANEVKLTLKVDDNGSLAIVAKEAKSAASATDKLNQSQNKLNKSRNNYNKIEKGVGQAGLSAGKGFSKQAQAIQGGLVPAYAVLAANVFAITAAFGVLQRAGALNQLREGLIAVGNAAGQNLPFIASQLKEITGAAVSSEQAMRATAVAMSAGFSTVQLKELTAVAKGASLALGRDMGDALDRLVRGTAKLEPEILDELGIMVRLDDAVRDFAIANNKAVSSITQFERRQAFLNATIEQGRKKFDEITEVVDVNPYDKLSASFSDLSHTVIQFVSKGLTPLVEFLSSNPVALFSSLAIFGKGVISQIIPSIQEVSQRQSALAAESIMAAKRAGKSISTEYINLSKKVNAIEYSSPSLKKLRKQFEQGTVSAASLQDILKKGEAAERRRSKTLEEGSKFMKRASQESIDAKRKELQAVQDLNRATKELIDNENRRLGVSKKGKTLRQKGRMSRREGAGLQAIDSASYLGGLGIAAKQSKRQFGEIEKASGGLNKVVTGFKAATSSAKLFGTALLRMIPIIGQLTFAATLLSPLFGDLFSKSKTQKAVEDVSKSFESLITIANRLNKVLADESASAVDKYIAKLKVSIGIIDQFTNGLATVDAARQKELQEELTEVSKKLNEARASLKKFESENTSSYSTKQLALYKLNLAAAQKQVSFFENEVNNTAKSMDVLDKASTLATMTAFIALLENTGLGDQFPGELEKLKTLFAQVEDGTITTGTALQEAANSISESNRKIESGISGSQDAFKRLKDEAQTLGQKAPTQFSKVQEAFQSLANETRSVGDSNVVAEQVKGSVEEATKLVAVMKKLGREDALLEAAEEFGTLPGIFQATADAIADNEQIMVTSAANAKILTEEANKLKQVSKENGFLMEKQLEFEKQALEEKLKGKIAERENFDLAGLTEDQKLKIAKLDREIAGLRGQVLDSSVKEIKVNEARLRGQKRLNDALLKAKGLQLDILKAQDDLNKRNLTIGRAGSGAGLNAQDELDLFNKTKDERKKLERENFELRFKAIDLEYDLLAQKFKLEEFRLTNTLKAQGATADQITAETQVFKAAQSAVESQRNLAIQLAGTKIGVTLDTSDLERDPATGERKPLPKGTGPTEADATEAALELKVLREANARALREINNEIERANALGRTTLAVEKELQKATLDRTQKEAIYNDLVENNTGTLGDSVAISNAHLDVEEAITKEIEARIAKREEEIDTIERLGGETQSAFAKFVTGIANATEEGGVFEKGFKLTAEGVKTLADSYEPLLEQFKKFGPDGEIAATAIGGAFKITEAFLRFGETLQTVFKELGPAALEGVESIGEGFDKLDMAAKGQVVAAGLDIAAAGVSTVGAILEQSSQKRIAQIDNEIKAEQARDGKSAASVARIQAMEKKKVAIEKKAFETKKKIQLAEAVIGGAAAIARATMLLANPLTAPMFPMIAGLIAATTAAQIALIAGQSFNGGSKSLSTGGGTPASIEMGKRSNVVDVSQRASGGELSYLRGARGSGTNANDFTPAFYGTKRTRAVGGSVAGYTVGEQGPELFVPSVPGQIVPNDEATSPQAINVNFNVQAIDSSSFNDALTVQRGNIISMIREAANSSGEGFLETVDTESLKMEK